MIEEEIKTLHNEYNKQKLKEFMTPKPTLQKILKGNLHIEKEDRHNQE
jgi:hypothetical protein